MSVVSEVDPKSGQKRRGDGVQNNCKDAAGAHAQPEIDPCPEHCRKNEEHRQRRQDIPECGFRVTGDPLGIASIAPEPQNSQQRYQRQLNDQRPEGRAALGNLRYHGDDNAG